MAKPKAIKWKSVFLGIIALILFCCAYVFLTLFAVPVTPVEYKARPELMLQGDASASPVAVHADEVAPPSAAPSPSSPPDRDVDALANGVFFEGTSPEQFAALFDHPDPDVREAAARALARCYAANGGMIEPRAEGDEFMRRWEIMEAFWTKVDEPTILNALLEVISASTEMGGNEFNDSDGQVLYLLGWFPGMNAQRAETLAWVANHHPSDDMRRSAMFFLVANDAFPREIGDEVLDSRAHDPAPRVRFDAFMHRVQRIL